MAFLWLIDRGGSFGGNLRFRRFAEERLEVALKVNLWLGGGSTECVDSKWTASWLFLVGATQKSNQRSFKTGERDVASGR